MATVAKPRGRANPNPSGGYDGSGANPGGGGGPSHHLDLKVPNYQTASHGSAPTHHLGLRVPNYQTATGSTGGGKVTKNRYDPAKPATIEWNDSGLSGKNRNASAALINVLSSYGLSSLAPDVVNYVKKGYDQSTIYLELQQTKAWQTRFAGNTALQKQGLAPLSPADYLSTEASYGQVMRQYGLPKGFMDSPSDFANLIGKGVSPSELQTRAQDYTSFVATKDSRRLRP